MLIFKPLKHTVCAIYRAMELFSDFSSLSFISWCPNPRAFYIVYRPAAPIDIAHRIKIRHNSSTMNGCVFFGQATSLSAVSVWIKNFFFQNDLHSPHHSFIHIGMSFFVVTKSCFLIRRTSWPEKKNQVFVNESSAVAHVLCLSVTGWGKK